MSVDIKYQPMETKTVKYEEMTSVEVKAQVKFSLPARPEPYEHVFDISLTGQYQGPVISHDYHIQFDSHPITRSFKTITGIKETVQPGNDTELEEILYSVLNGHPLDQPLETTVAVQIQSLLERPGYHRVAVKVFNASNDAQVPVACWIVDLALSYWTEYGQHFSQAKPSLVGGECLDPDLPFNLCRAVFPDLDM